MAEYMRCTLNGIFALPEPRCKHCSPDSAADFWMQLQMRWVILEDANRAIIVVAAMRVVSDTVREIKYQILQLILPAP